MKNSIYVTSILSFPCTALSRHSAHIFNIHVLKLSWNLIVLERSANVTKLTNGPTIVVDYAHPPDAISYSLETAKSQGAHRITHVFGFRGDRDPSKRKDMLSLTAELSDRYILTLDDLYKVSQNDMMEVLMHLNNLYGNQKGSFVPDRTLAIQKAIHESKEGDWIVITGKGHEKYQQNFHLPTASDRETVNFIMKLK